MDWASRIFAVENRFEPSDFIERIWRTSAVPEKAMISVAVPRWQLIFVTQPDRPTTIVARGPETRASIVGIPEDAEFLGIDFKLGAFMPGLAIESLVDKGLELEAFGTAMSLAGSMREIPTFENAADFVAHLARDGALVRDAVVEQTMLRQPLAITERSVQRRFLRATGLTFGAVRQMERAQRAAELLTAGVSILDAVDIAGYSDQAHMTRSLQRFLGKTSGSLRKP